MVIRIADENDLPGILALYAQPDMDDNHVLTIEAAAKIFDKMKIYPDYHVYVAEIDGMIVGTFELLIIDNLAHMGCKSGIIEDVVVLESHRGQGIGKMMMHFAIEVCKEKLCYKVSLSSNLKRNDAHRFYESLCFKVHGYSFLMELKSKGLRPEGVFVRQGASSF